MNESTVSNPPMPAYIKDMFNTIKGRQPNTMLAPLPTGGMNEAQVSNPPMPAYLEKLFKMIKERKPNTMLAPLPTGGKRRKNTRKYKKRKITRKIYRGGQAIPKPTISFLRSFIDPNAVNKVFNNTAIISITYPTQIVDNLYKLDARLLSPNGTNIANIKIKNINNVRELTVSELQASIRYQLTVKLVNKATNNKSVDSNTLTIEIRRPPAPRPAPRAAARPAPRPAPRAAARPAQSSVASNIIMTYAISNNPTGLALDASGNLFIAAPFNNHIQRVDANMGTITTVAGTGLSGNFSGDGGPATSASLSFPFGVAVDGSSKIYIADRNNNRIRRVNLITGVITTVVGNGNYGFSGDGGPARNASLAWPLGVIVDNNGNLYISDTNNNRIRRVDVRTNIITTVAGCDGCGGDDGGPATSASLDGPCGMALDSSGNLLIADLYNNRIRRVDARTGIITTVAGTGEGNFGGDGGPATSARLKEPAGVTVDNNGNIFIADTVNNRVRRVAADTGIITTVVGNGEWNLSGDDELATNASLRGPNGVALDGSGNLFIVDFNNHRIRKVNGPFV